MPTQTHPHRAAARAVRPARRVATALGALIAALALLALAAPAHSSGAPRALPDRSYLATGPSGLTLALVVHAGRLEAYACDGTARKAFFAARARRGRHVLRTRAGDRLAVRLGARTARATLTLKGGEPLRLTARRARAAIFTVTVQPDRAVFGTAPNDGVLAAHFSQLGLVGALGFAGLHPRAFTEPGFARAPLHVDGTPVPYPPDRAAEALAGTWRWIVTPTRITGATTSFIDLNSDLAIPAGTKFVDQDVGI